MPRNGSGTYTVPITYTPGTLASAADVNSNFTDVATAMTGSLPRDGQAGMTGPAKLADGTLANPSLTFDSDQDTGIRRTGSGAYRLVSNGADVAEITATGIAILAGSLTGGGSTPIGAGMDFWGATAPAGWLFPYGQAISRTTYAALFAILSTTYGVGDGSTTFNLPDKRDRASFGKGDMGGTPANRITNQSGGWEGDTLGASGGAQSHTLTEAQLAAHGHGASVSDPGHTHASGNLAVNQGTQYQTGTTATPAGQVSGSVSAAGTGISVSITSSGSNQAHNNLPPGIVCNYIIFAGA